MRKHPYLRFLLHCYSDIGVGGKPNLGALHFSNEAGINEMMVTLVFALATIPFNELDTVVFYPINRADVCAVSTDDFHMFFDLAHVSHSTLRL